MAGVTQIEDLDACSSPMLRIAFGQGNPCSAISVGAAGLAGATARCLLRLTHSGRFCLSANDPLGHRFLRSPLQCFALSSVRRFDLPLCPQMKIGTTIKVIPIIHVEHRGVEPRLTSLRSFGQVRNSRLPSLPFGRLLCSPGFRLASSATGGASAPPLSNAHCALERQGFGSPNAQQVKKPEPP